MERVASHCNRYLCQFCDRFASHHLSMYPLRAPSGLPMLLCEHLPPLPVHLAGPRRETGRSNPTTCYCLSFSTRTGADRLAKPAVHINNRLSPVSTISQGLKLAYVHSLSVSDAAALLLLTAQLVCVGWPCWLPDIEIRLSLVPGQARPGPVQILGQNAWTGSTAGHRSIAITSFYGLLRTCVLDRYALPGLPVGPVLARSEGYALLHRRPS